MEPDKRQRKHPRLAISGLIGDVVDEKKKIQGTVEDISSGGFKVANLSSRFHAEKHSYTILISGKGNFYKLLAKPCWIRDDALGNSAIGFKVLDAPLEWLELTMISESAARYGLIT